MTNQIEVINPDGAPFPLTLFPSLDFPNRVVCCRVQNPGPEINRRGERFEKVEVHDTVTLEIKNTHTSLIQITQLSVDHPEDWSITTANELPIDVSPNTVIPITIQFIAQESGNIKVVSDKLTITTADEAANEAATFVELSGLWQKHPEGDNEPKLKAILQAFGYGTNIPTAKLNSQGRSEAIGDEVISALWKRANPEQPARLYQLAAYHSRDTTARVRWYAAGMDAARGTEIFKHHVRDAQSLLPRTSNGSPQSSGGIEFIPGSDLFGFNIDSVSSDPTRNQRTQQDEGRFESEGHHVRFWPAKDATKTIIPDTWIMTMDYLGPKGGKPNWDYNDNVYLVTNINPA